MEKIIYNNKLKKVLIILLMVMLLSNFIVPVAMATSDEESSGTYDAENQQYVSTLKEQWKDDYEWVPEDVKLTDEEIIGRADLLYPEYITNPTTGLQVWSEENHIENQACKAAMIAFNNKIDELYNDNKKDDGTVAISLYEAVDRANGTAYDAAEEEREEEKENLEKSENVDGGILLEPLFALVNIVADTITSFLGEFMIGGDGLEGYYFESGKSNLRPANAESLTKDDVFRVSTESFALGTSYYDIRYTPEKIFSGEVPILSVDFISGQAPKLDSNGDVMRDEDGDIIYDDNSDSDWMSIRKVISDWYKVLRMIAIIGLLSVLIYTGIKIIISANAKDKAKYKEWIINWFIAVAILFSMHYIMSFINSVTNEISQLLSDSCQEIVVEEVSSTAEKDKEEVNTDNVFTTNLMGLVRYMVRSENAKIKIGYEIMYIALITYTIKFTFIYLKRVLNMAFLTLIAPIVALTYPIDKINDGKAQGFDMWLKEYTFNALLQPMHLILYYILVGSSVGIAASNPLYGIVVLMFMTEAEKLLKKIFGFDKAGAGTVGGMAGAFAAGAIASNIKNIAKMSKLGGGNGGKDGPGLPKNDAIDGIKAVTDASDMSGWDAHSTGGLPSGSSSDSESPTTSDSGSSGAQPSVQQRMEEAYGENNFGTQDYEPAEREAMAREAYTPEGRELTDEEKRQMLRDQGMTEEEINDSLGVPVNNDGGQISGTDTATSTSTASTSAAIATPATEPIGELAEQRNNQLEEKKSKGNPKRGWAEVGKTIARPIYDFDRRENFYNGKRWLRRIGRAALGGAIGITAAAVQAGISITDGKYNPMEGLATFAAGYAGGGQIAKGLGGLVDIYYEGANAGDKQAQLERAQKRYGNRDDVIAFNKKNYAAREKEVMQRQRDNYMKYGYTDPKDMKGCIKYADAWIKNTYGDRFNELSDEQKNQIWKQADDRAVRAMAFKDRLKSQGQSKSLWDDDKRDKYIEQMVKQEAGPNASDADKQRIRARYQEAFKSAREYDNAQ